MVGDRYELEAKGLTGADIFLDEPSVTGTENALMAAVAAKGRTVLRNAACEPHVQDLARALVAMGAQIEGIGSNIYTIEGGRPLGGRELRDRPRPHRDRQLHRARRRDQRRDHHRSGAGRTTSAARCSASSGWASGRGSRARRLTVDADQERRIRPDLGGHVPKLEDGPWPAFPADVMSTTIVTATQCAGMLLVFEKMFESRLFFVDKLIGMGARIVLCDPHRAVISGPSPLKGGTVESPDIRAGMAMLLAALAAEGTEHDPQRRPDRAGLRADRRAAPGARRGDRAARMRSGRPRGGTADEARGTRRRAPVRVSAMARRARAGRRHHRAGRRAGPRIRPRPLDRGAGGRSHEPLAAPSAARSPGSTRPSLGHQVHGVEVMPVGPARGWMQIDGVDGWVTDRARRAAHGDGRGLHPGVPGGAGHGASRCFTPAGAAPRAASSSAGLERLLGATGAVQLTS